MKIFQAIFSRRWIVTTILVLIGTGVCIRLGIWQLDRLAQRRAFNDAYLEATMSSPLQINSFPKEDLSGMEYRSATVVGIYDFNNNVVLRNQYHDGQPGYFLITPMVLSDGSAILIERGWIPAQGNSSPADWHKYDLAGPVQIQGIIRLGQTQPEIGGVPDPELSNGQTRLDFWNLLNIDRISLQVPYKLLPVFIQPNPDAMTDSPPYPFQPLVEINDGPHLGYALQWFTFASILFFGYPFFLRKQLPSRISMEN